MNFDKWIQTSVDMVFPRRCPICDRSVKPFGAIICKECEGVPVPVGEHFCLRCGKNVDPGVGLCDDCRRIPHRFRWGCSVFTYRSVAESLYRFKYEGRREYAEFYGRKMAARFENVLSMTGEERPEVLIPVPISKERLRNRGYNQAEILARKLGKNTDLPTLTDILTREEPTKALKGMSALERQKNLKMTFHAYGNGVNLKSVMLVDDIYTTGATMDACAGALHAIGVRDVSFITLAIGERNSGDTIC